jgi:alanyl-tRNA synthetase
MTSAQIRQAFLDFFKSKQHTIVPSSSLLPDSPNLLFTNAGMNQFVPIFLGQAKCPYQPGRAADTQKCIRAGGKHNDLEDVGLDTYHHTFFEMLGNWSFGDYFKKEAIEWAWELVTSKQWFGFPPERLYVTVYFPKIETDSSGVLWAMALRPAIAVALGELPESAELPGSEGFDGESIIHWARLFHKAGLNPVVHIVPGGKQDNFWMMGDTGPCGPCSEIHVDLTPQGDTQGKLVNKNDARCIEIWNLVFIQFNANADGTFTPLPTRNVDTGMGFERVAAIIQGTKGFKDFAPAKISNYETDIFRPLFDALEKLSGKKYGSTLPQLSGSATVPVASVGVAPTESVPRGAGYYQRRLPHFERQWVKYMVSFTTRERRQLSPQARDIVLKFLLFGHEQRRYQLYAACVMPDHVHFLFEPQIKEQDRAGKPVFWPLAEILHGIKSFTAHEISKAEKTKGQIWENESFDRVIRGEADLEEKFHYICRKPWDSGVVPPTENYPWLWTPDAVAPDAQPSDRDGHAPPSQEQIQIDIAFRVIADHIRTLSFAIADGIQPSNESRGYVLRRILRRAVRYGRALGFHEPFFYKLVDVLADTMGDVFPEVRARKEHVQEVIRAEEEAFNKTLDRGIELFEQEIQLAGGPIVPGTIARATGRLEVLPSGEQVEFSGISTRKDPQGKMQREITGGFAFKLYDTYGFPLDLTELMARERGLTVDKEGFEKLMEEQRARARAAQKKEVVELAGIAKGTSSATGPLTVADLPATKFVGYDKLETPAKVLEVVSPGDKTAVILDTSPCYAEMGGQVGDTGKLEHGRQLWRIVDTQKSGNAWLHFLETENLKLETFPAAKSTVTITVDKGRRNAIERHHTVTHLLHWALHEVVSRHAAQKGSFVGPDKLTFDFSSKPLTPQQVADAEKLVNERIVENAGVSWTEVPYADVKSRKDVRQFFGEKYGDVVRVVQVGGNPGALNGYSMELCGGTHVRATGEIGLFRIVGENAIAAGVRRIEAVAGLAAYDVMKLDRELIRSVSGKVNSPIGELEKKIASLLEQQKALEKQLKARQQKEAAGAAKNLVAKAVTMGGKPAIVERFDADGDTLQGMVNELKGQFKGVIVLGGASGGAVALVASVSSDYTAEVPAGKIIQQIAPVVGGKGGGKPDNARGGGKDVAKLNEALAKAKEILNQAGRGAV